MPALNDLDNPIFHDGELARQWLESILWPKGPLCIRCGESQATTPIGTRRGWYQCNSCRSQFSVTMGTPMERSHIPLNKWLMAVVIIHDDRAISVRRLHSMIGVSYKSTWNIMPRFRELALNQRIRKALAGITSK